MEGAQEAPRGVAVLEERSEERLALQRWKGHGSLAEWPEDVVERMSMEYG